MLSFYEASKFDNGYMQATPLYHCLFYHCQTMSNFEAKGVTEFGIPATIITDNGTQFVNDPFKKWAEKLKIQLISTSVYYPQENGAVERANKSLLRGIKTRLEKGGSAWAEEVPNVLWAHRTMKKTNNGETPFSLTYGTEAVIPAEIGMPTHKTSNVNEKTNDQELRLNLDLLDERREIAAIREARNEVSRAANTGKLGPTWEGPYKVIQAFQSGAYKLSNMEGEEIPRTWHACNLRRHMDGGDDVTVEQTRKKAKWDNDNYVCRGLILNGMSDSLFDIYQNVESFKELWDSLEAKYMVEDDQVRSSWCIIDKLLPSWKDFKHTLKHLKEKLTLVELGSHLRIKESLRMLDSDKPKGNNVAGLDSIFNKNRLSSIPRPSLRILNGTEDIGGSVVPEEVTEEVVQQPKPELRKSKRNRNLKSFGPKF
ncbi:reverse transcriptase domain-containing protein [Tanacetum coccineum]